MCLYNKLKDMKLRIILTLLFLHFISCGVQGQNTHKSSFVFPFTSIDKQWEQYKTIKERIDALQIPTSIIQQISTELLYVCLQFPYLSDALYSSNITTGIDCLINEFNGFQELINREDLPNVLVNCISYQLSNKRPKEITWRHNLQLFVVGLIIADKRISSKIADNNRKRLQAIVSNYFNEQKENTPRYNMLISIPIQLMSEKGIITLSQVNNEWIDSNYTATSIKTPFKSDVPDTYRFIGQDQYFSIEDSVEMAEEIYANYNGAVMVRLPTYKYNCHGYAWSVSEGGEEVWIGKNTITAEDVYWLDSSYVEADNILNAKKVSYHPSGNHSAIMINQNLFESKWGWGGPLVRHSPNNVPTKYNPNLEKKYYKKTVLSISGSTVICDSTSYSIENLPNALNVSWSIDNSHFTLSPNGTQCTVTFNDVPQYDEATLTATILKDTITVTTLSKRIVMHGTDMYLEGVQSGIYDENGDMPAVAATFSIPANNGLRRIGNRLSTINRDSLEMTSLPVVFENMRTITIPDNPTYGITEIYGGADIYLDGERLDGMTISFSGDRAPEYLSADGGTMIAFRMPEVSSITDVQGYYYVVLHATSEGGCHDFDLYFKVIPVEGESIGDSEISLYFTDSSVRVDFDAMEWTELPNGMLQPIPWYLRIFRMSTGAQMHYSVNNTESKTVDISTWPADVYIVRVDSGENRYTKKFLKQ